LLKLHTRLPKENIDVPLLKTAVFMHLCTHSYTLKY